MLRPLCVVALCASFAAAAKVYPSALAHGMGDSCFNAGMKEITALVGKTLDTYATCVPTGATLAEDTNNGFFMTMNKNVDAFAAAVRNDTGLAGGFNCVGFSQGNSVCRGYVQRYNDPPVRNVLSVHGTVVGVAAFPHCDPTGLMGPVCRLVASLAGDAAYTSLTQGLLFQIDYYRDPLRVTSDAYKAHSELAAWNNEGNVVNETYKRNFVSVDKWVMIKASKDTMIHPNEGEHWGAFADGSLKKVLPMRETPWYVEDLFGLKTVDERGGIFFNATAGDHMQFTKEELVAWLEYYFL